MGEAVIRKPVKGFPGYMVYEDGRIYSTFKQRFLNPVRLSTGYDRVELFNENGSKQLLVHRIVADAFIPNPSNYPCINHKDEIKHNNHVSNLEWCTYKYNVNYGTCQKKRKEHTDYKSDTRIKTAIENGKKCGKPVKCLDSDKNEIGVYLSAMDAQRKTGIRNQHIIESCKNKSRRAGGYYWEYIN